MIGFTILGIAVFLATSILGYVYPQYWIVEQFFENVRNILSKTGLSLVLAIFLNNLRAAIIVFVGGALFIIPGLLFLGINGLLVGSTIKYAAEEFGTPLEKSILLIVPHGIIEIPAIALAFAFGARCFLKCRSLESAAKNILVAAITITTLLLIAAFVEVFITPRVAGFEPP